MYLRRVIPLSLMFRFAWRPLLAFGLFNLAVLGLYEGLGWRFVGIPFLPVATIGTAVAFYVGFKNNSSYERLWEARKVWGAIANASRAWGMLVVDVVGAGRPAEDRGRVDAIRRELVYRQIAWVHLVRIGLRSRSVWGDEAAGASSMQVRVVRHLGPAEEHRAQVDRVLAEFVPGDGLAGRAEGGSLPNALLQAQSRLLTRLKVEGVIDAYEHSDLEKLLVELLAQHGAADRIKTFPFPRQYAFFSGVFVNIFLVLLPFALLGELAGKGASWLVVPFGLLISWVFTTMEQVGDSSENPFEGGLNDVPMTAISRRIEIDLRAFLGESDLPSPLGPVDGVLM